MNAPPRSITAPAAFTAFAVFTIWSSPSTEQGPAMTASVPSPKRTPWTSTTVFSGLNSRLTSLKGWRIGTTRSTPAVASSDWRRSSLVWLSPTTPMTVRSTPTDRCVPSPAS